MKQQIIIFFAIVATLQFCSTTASPVEPNEAKDKHEQEHQQQPGTVPKVNMKKVEAVKELCEVLINSSNAHEAAKKQKPEAHQGAEHGKMENHEGTVGHAGNDHAEHKNEQEKPEHNQEHVNQAEHKESCGADQGQHHHHHHHHHHNNGEGNTETQNHQ